MHEYRSPFYEKILAKQKNVLRSVDRPKSFQQEVNGVWLAC